MWDDCKNGHACFSKLSNTTTIHLNEEDILDVCGICHYPEEEDEFWIECPDCFQWFHASCFEIDEDDKEIIDTFHCGCKDPTRSQKSIFFVNKGWGE
eukprot:TRINITY_DN10252_c0_g1_i1.p1 TRINITY_DN10252_c0_g1~~TRINITY_DN10252_c0_g1_i1.p1  ORF type:complete len:109 (+),score=22.69 TRINITY_DN10252_c0_g1_i1:37-327(+)